MIVFQKEPAVERMMDFVAIYATREAKSQTEVRKFNKKYKINLHVLMFIV
jgi:hypothetical protein